MTTGDCFIMLGSSKKEPMTLYRIDSVRGDKIEAFSILIKKEQIIGLDFPDEYDNDIPEESIELPRDTYDNVKQRMEDFVTHSCKLIRENLVGGDFEIELGKRYVYRGIYTITKLENQRAYYDLFRIDTEIISPCWSGDINTDGIKEMLKPINEGVYQELLCRYKSFVTQLQEYLFTLAENNPSITYKD